MVLTSASFLGIDVARDGLGLTIISAAGEVVATLQRSYSATPAALSDPQDWWRAARTGIKEILRRSNRSAAHIRCIGLTGDSYGTVALDKDGKVLCPTTLGPDPRAAPYAEQLTRTIGARNLLNLASGPATSASTAAKLLWLRAHEKRVWHDLAYVLPPKDFVRFRLCGTLVTDAYDAAATLLFNPKSRTWSKQLLSQLEINPAWLPGISSGQSISGRVTQEAAKETGLQASTPVVTGAGHVAAAAIAVNALHPGSAMIELGGDGSLFVPTADSVRDSQARLLATCHALPGTWALAGSGFAGGDSIAWLMEQVVTAEVQLARRTKRDPLDLLAEIAAEVPPGSDGLLFLSPSLYPEASGFIGLSPDHKRGHLVRAVLESGALALRQVFEAIGELKRRPDHITVTGTGAANNLWCQILADALDQQVKAIPCDNCNALGAAMLASSAVGIYKTIDLACAKMVQAKSTHNPRKAATDVYAALAPFLARLPGAVRAARHPSAQAEATR